MADFNGQWVEVFAVGRQIDSEGREHNVIDEFLEDVVRNYDPIQHEAPAVIGHPADNTPAYGWTRDLRVRDGRLEVKFKEVDPQFEEMVKKGYFKKRSASFYVDSKTAPGGRAPYLRHVGFLGAQPPAVKALRGIQFDEGEALTFEITTDYSEGTMELKDEQGFIQKLLEGIKTLLPKKDEAPASASFTEADRSKLIEDVVKKTTEALTANFTEQLKQRDTQISELRTKMGEQSATTTHAQLVAFCDGLGKDKCPPAFREMGLVEFMESLVVSDKKVTVISFEEADGKKTEKKEETAQIAWFKNFLEKLGPFIQFGERFGSLSALGSDDATAVDPKRMNALRDMSGIPTKEVQANA